MFKMLKNQKGMTLVELLAVMVIVGIIAAISIPAIGNLIENSRKDAVVSTATSLVEAARMYVTAEGLETGTHTFTATNSTPGTNVEADLVQEGYLDAPAKCPDKTNYTTANVVVEISSGKTTYTVTLNETTKTKGKYNITGKKLEELNREIVGS